MPNQSPSQPRQILINELIQRWNIHLCEAIRIVGTVEAGEDVLQNTALKCLTKAPRDALDFPGRYVSRMVRNAAIDYIRKHRREVPVPHDDEENIIRAGATHICGRTHLERKQDLKNVARVLADMPTRSRHVLLRHRLAGVRQKQIAKELEISPTLVNFIIKDAEALCKEAIEV